MSAAGFLVVRAGGERYGLDLEAVEEVMDLGPPTAVPGRLPAFRGVVRWRSRHVAVLHLGALVGGGTPPAGRGDTALVVRLDGTPVALEVDDVTDVVEGEGQGADASGVRVVGDALVTMLDLAALAARTVDQGEVG